MPREAGRRSPQSLAVVGGVTGVFTRHAWRIYVLSAFTASFSDARVFRWRRAHRAEGVKQRNDRGKDGRERDPVGFGWPYLRPRS
jgi:hypothetical protein